MKLTGFNPFDARAGGLGDTGSYLVCGSESGGKTSFSLGFLHRGLQGGETAALVTNQSPPRILDKARQLGFHLNDYLVKKQLLIFEYPEQVAAAVAKLEDHTRMVDEFHGLLGNRKVERVVFDPVNPLVGGQAGGEDQRSRFHSVIKSFGRLRACVVYVMEGTPENSEIPADSVHGVLTFGMAAGRTRRLRADLYSPARTTHRFVFEIREGLGLQEAAEEPEEPRSSPIGLTSPGFPPRIEVLRQEGRNGESLAVDDFGGEEDSDPIPTPSLAQFHTQIGPRRDSELQVQPARQPQSVAPYRADSAGTGEGIGPRILLVEADASKRLNLRAQLERNFVVIEASGVHDTQTLAVMGQPDAILMAMDMPGVSGLELARMLREKGHNMLIVGMGDRMRHVSERLGALAAGVDLCFAYSTDARLLRLTLLNLMQRLGRVPGKELSREADKIARRQDEDTHRCTLDLARFCGRIARETLYARENGLPFVILAFRLPEVPEAIEQFAGLAASLASGPDLIYAGPHGVACLLAETESPQRFLGQLWEHWGGGFSPTVEELRYANQDAFLQRARQFVGSRAGTGMERKPMAMAAAANGPTRGRGYR